MRKCKKHFFSAITAFAVTASAMAAFPVQYAGDNGLTAAAVSEQAEDEYTIRVSDSGRGENYEVWKPGEEGTIDFSMNKYDLSFNCTWKDTKRADFFAGSTSSFDLDEYKKYYLKYRAEVDCKDSYGFGASMICYEENDAFFQSDKKSVFTEVRIFESYSGISDISDDKKAGSVTVGGVDYDLYRSYEIINDIRAEVLIIARAQSLPAGAAVNGTLDIKAFAEELKKQGIILTKTDDFRAMVYSEEGSGSVSVYSNELVAIPYPEEMNVPNYDIDGKSVYRDGITYQFWHSNGGTENGEMKVKRNGNAFCTYNNSDRDADCLYRKGIIKENGIEYGNVTIDYNGGICPDSEKDVYAVGINYVLGDPAKNFFIAQFHRSDSFTDGAELLGTADIKGVEYRLYKKVFSKWIMQNGMPYTEYWCVNSFEFESDAYGFKGDADLADYIGAWKTAGIDAGNRLYEVSAFAETFGEGSGEINICDVNISIDKPEGEETVLNRDNPRLTEGVYRYYAAGDGTCTLESSGTVVGKSFQEHDGETFSFGKGVDFGEKEIDKRDVSGLDIAYKANVSSDGNYCIGVEGRMRGIDDELHVMYHIIDRANFDPVPQNAEYLGEKEIYGDVFELYVVHTRNTFKFGGRSVDEYYSVRKKLSGSHENFEGIIYVGEHVRAWRDAGLAAGNITSLYLNADMYGKGDGVIEFDRSNIRYYGNEPLMSAEYTTDDIALLSSFLLGQNPAVPGGKDYDLNGDGVWDSFDLCIMKGKVGSV